MESLTLAQWVRDYKQALRFDHETNTFICHHDDDDGYNNVWRVSDFTVRSVNGATVYFDGPFLKIPVRSREEFNSLSFFTLCGISDALMVCSIEGMVNTIARGPVSGLLYTDTLGNFLAIE